MEPLPSIPAPRTTRQDEILDRALELARQGGLARLTMRRIAERIGFTDAAMYRHFPTKQALLLALADRLEGALLGEVRRILDQPGLDARQRLEAILSHHVRVILETDGLPLLIVAEAASTGDDVVAERMARVLRSYLGIVTRLVGELPTRPGAPPAGQEALVLLGLPAALAIQRRLLHEGGVEIEVAQRLARTLIARLVGDRHREEG